MPEPTPPARQKLLEAIRTFNKHVFNKLTLSLAESGRGPFTILRHTGRQSGRIYRTPVLASYAGDEIIIPLSYGREVDWLRNILANSGCEIVRNKKVFSARDPRIVSIDAATRLPESRRKLFKRHHIEEVVILSQETR